MRTSLLLATLLVALPAATAHATVVTEPPDLSGDVTTPTPITLTNGSNSVTGSLATPGDRQDNFTVTVPAGHELRGVSLLLDGGGGFMGSVTFNLLEVRTDSGAFTMGLPLGPGTYVVQVVTDFSLGNAWSMSFAVRPTGSVPECGDGAIDPGETCDDGNDTECDGCSSACAEVLDGCFIEGVCLADTATHPMNGCAGCVPDVSRTGWSPLPRDRRCDDGVFCTMRDACDGAGVCIGSPMTCDDGDTCTTDSCDEAADMCAAAPIAGCAGADAGTTDNDAGPPNGDAGHIHDAGGSADAAANAIDASASPDAGGTAPSSGCSCRAGSRHASMPWLLVVAIAVGLVSRRRS